MNDTTLFPCW